MPSPFAPRVRRRRLNVFVLLIATSILSGRPTFGQDRRVSVQRGDQAEPAIAVNPADPSHLIAAALDTQAPPCLLYVSFDGGGFWAATSINPAPREVCTDPSVAFDSTGTAYFAGLFFDRPEGMNGRIAVARSDNGGRTYGVPTLLDVAGTEDKPYMAVDRSGGPGDGTIYVAFSTFIAPSMRRDIWLARSVDRGASFAILKVTTTGDNFAGVPAVGPDGELYVAWRDYGNNPAIKIAQSVDGGVTFSPATTVQALSQVYNLPGPVDFRNPRHPSIAVSHAPETRGKVYVAYHDTAPENFALPRFPGAELTTYVERNAVGNLVGNFRLPGEQALRPYINSAGMFRPINVPGAVTARAYAINDLDQVAGVFTDASGEMHVFTWFGERFAFFDFPEPGQFAISALNNNGQLVGTYSGGGFFLDTRLFPPGIPRRPVHPDAYRTTDAQLLSINDQELILGFRGFSRFLIDRASWTEFELELPGNLTSINNAREILISNGDGATSTVVRALDSAAFARVNGNGTHLNNAGEVLTSTGLVFHARSPNPPMTPDDPVRRDTDVFVVRSSDGGSTWSGPVRVNDAISGDQFMPWACVGQDGRVHVAWLDRRNSGTNVLHDTYYASSIDGGRTFSVNQRVSGESSDPNLAYFVVPADQTEDPTQGDQRISGFMGDYIGLACTGDTAYAIWPDTRNGLAEQDIYMAATSTPLVTHVNGTVTDTSTGLMWTQDALLAFTTHAPEQLGGSTSATGVSSIETAASWAEGLAFAGFSDWRLPHVAFHDDTCDDGAGSGFNCRQSEAGHLFYTALGNRAGVPTRTGTFRNVFTRTFSVVSDPATGALVLEPRRIGASYWMSLPRADGFITKARFDFDDGRQDLLTIMDDRLASAWPVRDTPTTNTTIGASRTIELGSGVSVTFSRVRDEGHSRVETSTTNPGGAIGELQFLGTFYDVTTSAVFTGPVTVCFSYDDAGMDANGEAALTIFHLTGNGWEEISVTTRDLDANVICGTVASFSWFGLAGPKPNRPPIVSAGDLRIIECTLSVGTAVQLTGSASDPDGDPLTYEWRDSTGRVIGTGTVLDLSLPLGRHRLTFTARDDRGGATSAAVDVVIQDTRAPFLSLARSDISVQLQHAAGAVIDVLTQTGAHATDVCDPRPVLTPSDPMQFPVGVTHTTVWASDASGNRSSASVVIRVLYRFAGFQAPLRSDGSMVARGKRVIPVKFQLFAADGTNIGTAAATLSVAKVTSAVLGTVEEAFESPGSSSTGGAFRYDAGSGTYVYNLSTAALTGGTYLLTVMLDDGSTHSVQVSVK